MRILLHAALAAGLVLCAWQGAKGQDRDHDDMREDAARPLRVA